MANYGQYNRNPQVTSEEAADALQQSIFDSEHLFQQYRDDISPLLQEAELRLEEEHLKKFKNMENIIKTHVGRWYRLTKNLSEMALNFRTQGNHIIVKLDSLKSEIDERDKIIRTQRKDYENEKDQYENQLKVLESALADSIPRNKTLSKYERQLDKEPPTTNAQIQQLTKDLAAQEQQYQKLKIENQRLAQNTKLLNSGANDFQQTLTNLNNEIAKKEDEILSLRWLTQDLAAERNGLEQKIQTGAKDPNFTSVTPQRQMNYDIDLSAFLDDDEDVSDDAAENGMLYLEMNDDADINPQVAKKLAEALEAVKKVTQFANDRDYEAKQLESRRDDKAAPSHHVVITDQARDSISDRGDPNIHTQPSKPSIDELYTNFGDMKKLEDSSPSKAHTLISQMGQFNGLIDYMETEESSYGAMLKRIESQIENGTKCINVITRCVSTVMEDESKSSANHNRQNKRSQKLRQLQNHSESLITILNEIMTELRGAADYIHPDQKKVELMENKMKELELTIPYIEAEQLAILNTLPSFLKQELNKRHRPNRIRNKPQDAQLDDEEEKQRQMNFDNALNRVEMLSIQIKEKTDVIKTSLRSNLEKSQTDPKAFAAYLQQIDIACDQISEYILSLDDEFHFAREYIHPSQAALIAVVNQYNNLQIDCEQMQTILSIKEGEITALEEIKATKPKRVIASSAGPPPGFEDPHALARLSQGPKPHSLVSRDESFQFDDIETDFMKFADHIAQESKQQTNMNAVQTIAMNEASGTAEVDADHIVPLMANILGTIKDRSATIRGSLKLLNQSGYSDTQYTSMVQLNYDLNNALNDMSECIDDMNTKLIRVKQIMGPDAKYISRLEKRYVQIMGLYQMKHAEVEHKSDLLYQSDQYINDLKEDISDLDYRLGAVMSSAVSNVDTRMKAFNEMGIKIQTFQKVMKLIDDTYTNIQQACQDIQESVEKDLYDIIGDAFNDNQHQETAGMLGNVAHACDYILKAFADIEQEMDGVAQFVHPDREMCEQLQLELIAMYENQEKEQQQKEMEMVHSMGNGNTKGDDHKDHEDGDILTNLPKRRHPDIKPGDSHDDIVIGRRKSLLAFHQAFDNEAKRRSNTYDNKLQKEDRRRSRHSSNRRRRSSVSNLPPGLLPLPDTMGDPQSKSDIGGYTLEQEALDPENKALLNSLRRSVNDLPIATRPDSTAPSPAPSPRNSPTQIANSPVMSDEDGVGGKGYSLNIEDAVEDNDIHVATIALNAMGNDGAKERDREREEQLMNLNRQKDKDIQLLKTQIDDKAQLIRDLKTNLRELTENRRRELLHFQQQLETMKSRCREWYEQLMSRVREMESAYQDKINQEVEKKQVELHREVNEERRRMRDEFEKQLSAAKQQQHSVDSNPHEMDELSRENARLNEELERFKGKYFDSEQQKIELADALDEIKEEKFKMEEKLEELAAKVAIAEQMRENEPLRSSNEALGRGGGDSHHGKSTGEWNDLVQKLREEKENQEAQYEEEFREFERMANEKVVQLEEYYVQQLQMKEVHVQQLQQQLQQQILAKQQQQPINQQNINQLNEQISGLNAENTKLNGEITKISQEHSKLNAEISKLNYQHSHDRDQLIQLKKRNDSNESKISAYNASFIELAEKLKQLNDDTKALRKDKDKKQRKVDKLEKHKKKFKQEIKQLNEKIDNITAVTKELVNLKHKTIRQTEQWEKERGQYEEEINRLKAQMTQNARKKIDSINRYNVEMNNLRTNIKSLQTRCVVNEAEISKMRETDSQSMLGSAAQWVPRNWWNTKK